MTKTGTMLSSTAEAPQFQIRPVEPVVVEAPTGNRIEIKYSENEPLGIYGTHAYWGLRIPTAEILLRLNEMLKPEYSFQSQGFEAIHAYQEGLSEQDAENWEIQAAVKNIKTLSERSGIPLDRIGLFAFACGTPIGDDNAAMMAYEAGIPLSRPRFEVNRACSSGARAHAKIDELVEAYPELAKEYVLLVAHEGMRRLLRSPFDTDRADPFSLSVFGNATAAMIYQPKNMRRIVSLTDQLEDEKGYLSATETYTTDKSPGAPLVQVSADGMKERIRLPTPPSGMKVRLKPIHATHAMGKFGGAGVRELIDLHDRIVYDPDSRFERRPIDLIIAHQPSAGLLIKIGREAGIDEALMPFLGRNGIDGNSSGATSIAAITKFIPEFRRGMHIAHVALGAGMDLSATASEMGDAIR